MVHFMGGGAPVMVGLGQGGWGTGHSWSIIIFFMNDNDEVDFFIFKSFIFKLNMNA